MRQSATPLPLTALLFSLSGGLVDFGARRLTLTQTTATPSDEPLHAPSPGALSLLNQLQQQKLPCAWLEQAPLNICTELSQQLPSWLNGFAEPEQNLRPLPAPDRVWAALSALGVNQVQGCVLISGEPKLLQAGLNAGLWTIGLALCGPLCGHSLAQWQNLPVRLREQLRSQATLNLYRLGVHSVIDQLSDAPSCLADLNRRRHNGEKP
ncbi:HAD family phosphatase [Pseudomonas sp. 5P_3.1_Bac2]|uniref:HAD family phosphatase n=1 Tax=Pseudomonas sp. 5P_3.1_Bac2 TaxID=2971617 RepID=UPI0021C7933B|nr:HAD family phosphatase [Pseudomonas sp. 5P_3.1_Bac2]MCU1718699.1 HAD family phosphatase [Pseudomonas sp. 5P_3.1_Bac2]